MGILGELFDDVVDIATSPIKVVSKVTDSIMETNTSEFVEQVKDSVKTESREEKMIKKLLNK